MLYTIGREKFMLIEIMFSPVVSAFMILNRAGQLLLAVFVSCWINHTHNCWHFFTVFICVEIASWERQISSVSAKARLAFLRSFSRALMPNTNLSHRISLGVKVLKEQYK